MTHAAAAGWQRRTCCLAPGLTAADIREDKRLLEAMPPAVPGLRKRRC